MTTCSDAHMAVDGMEDKHQKFKGNLASVCPNSLSMDRAMSALMKQ